MNGCMNLRWHIIITVRVCDGFIFGVQLQCKVPCPVPVVAGCRPLPGQSGLSAQLAYWCWWFPSEPAVLSSTHTQGKNKQIECLTQRCLERFLKKQLFEFVGIHQWWAAFCCTGLTSGGMCPRCIWPIVICCWADGMVPMLSDSVPMEPERITPGRATEPCSTRPTRLNCCWRMVDLQVHQQENS